ncbi:MAG: sll0787 family AIR synthase-like protein [Variovorax paradoxus]|nr:MAG: sll0787 family AIR synthase-like protein [Variovorax paradoxus]PZQ16721.1 MAG: sll0787 family AIR synthase-like protein [Variovorax paradoxus]
MSAILETTVLEQLAGALRASRGFVHKRDIAAVLPQLGPSSFATAVPNGDDCAVLPDTDGQGHLLLAIEGMVQDFVEQQPWFAGYSAVMVNLSDIAAMGGRALAVVDALWAGSAEQGRAVLAGMRAASERYGVPLVGGHTNLRSASGQLAVAVLGRAQRLISSFAAQPGDRVLVAVDLRGQWQGEAPFWNASTTATADRLRGDMALLPALAEAGLVDAGKDISMAGVLGTALMLLECSGVGATVDLARLPRPAGVPDWSVAGDAAAAQRLRWLNAFPSFGYVLSVRPAQADETIERFARRGIACADVGTVHRGSVLALQLGDARVPLWDLADQPFIAPAVEPRRVA